MAKGMDVGTMALLGGGGYLALAYHSGLWPFTSPASAAASGWTEKPSNYVPPAPKPPVTTQKPVDNSTPATPATSPAVGSTSVSNGATYQWNGSAWVLLKAAPEVQACQAGYHRQKSYDPTSPCMPDAAAPSATFCDTGTPGWSMQNGVCKQTPAPTPPLPISQQMVAAAGTSSGLSTDQWCYYYTLVTGNDCPVDPGSIDMTVYNGAGVVLEDGTIGDRTTPISIGTWLSIMQLQAPGLGLSGMGSDFMTPSIPLLIAAGVAALMFMGGGR